MYHLVVGGHVKLIDIQGTPIAHLAAQVTL